MKFEKSTVLNNVNIKVVPGELVGVARVARSDKSTLLLKEVEPSKVRKRNSAKKRIGRDHPSSEHCSGS
jgi:ABC-type polar amino acid transport system ATPase subunit